MSSPRKSATSGCLSMRERSVQYGQVTVACVAGVLGAMRAPAFMAVCLLLFFAPEQQRYLDMQGSGEGTLVGKMSSYGDGAHVDQEGARKLMGMDGEDDGLGDELDADDA